MTRRLFLYAFLLGQAVAVQAQDNKVTLSGSIQTDVLIPQTDSVIGAYKDGDWGKTNTYIDLMLQSHAVEAGARLEYLDHPLPQFENEEGFKGCGLPHFYVKACPTST